MFTVKNTVFDIHYARGITLIDSSLNPMSGRVMVMSGIMIISLLSSTTNNSYTLHGSESSCAVLLQVSATTAKPLPVWLWSSQSTAHNET